MTNRRSFIKGVAVVVAGFGLAPDVAAGFGTIKQTGVTHEQLCELIRITLVDMPQDLFASYLDASYTVYCQSFKNRGFFVKEKEDDPKNDDNNQA